MYDSDNDPVVRIITISVIDYCHHFRAYHASYHFPSFYYPVSLYVRTWVGLTNDDDWEVYINQVFLLSPYILISILNIILFRLLHVNSPSLCMQRKLITPFPLLQIFVAG